MFDISRVSYLGCALVLALSLSTVPQASLAAGDGVLVTDPDVLEEMGFARDAENVYMAPGADSDSDDLEDFSPGDADAKAFASQMRGPTFVTNAVWAKQFDGMAFQNTARWLYRGNLELSRAGGVEKFAEAQLTGLPDGAIFFLMDTWFRDAVPTADAAIFLFQACQPRFAAGPVVTTLMSSTATSGIDGLGFRRAGIPDFVVDNLECVYFLRVRFDASSTDLALQKILVTYLVPAAP